MRCALRNFCVSYRRRLPRHVLCEIENRIEYPRATRTPLMMREYNFWCPSDVSKDEWKSWRGHCVHAIMRGRDWMRAKRERVCGRQQWNVISSAGSKCADHSVMWWVVESGWMGPFNCRRRFFSLLLFFFVQWKSTVKQENSIEMKKEKKNEQKERVQETRIRPTRSGSITMRMLERMDI